LKKLNLPVREEAESGEVCKPDSFTNSKPALILQTLQTFGQNAEQNFKP